ncbi:hypothetical protein BH10PSE16_BH10PSE16_22520 [soil metagenome]
MKTLVYLVLMLVTPAFGEPAYYEAFDFKKCLHWKIDNEMQGTDRSKEPKQYMAALELANRQPYSRHKIMSAVEFDSMYRDHRDEVVVIYSADAYDKKSKKNIEKYGVCNPRIGMTCLPDQDSPLAGASYKEIPSKGALATFACVAGCTGAPATIHYMGYENMEGGKNSEQESALGKFRKMCGRAP